MDLVPSNAYWKKIVIVYFLALLVKLFNFVFNCANGTSDLVKNFRSKYPIALYPISNIQINETIVILKWPFLITFHYLFCNYIISTIRRTMGYS